MGSMGSSSVSTSSSNAAALADARAAFFLLTRRFGAAQGQGAAHRTAAAAGSPQNCITGVHTTAQDGIQCQGPSGAILDQAATTALDQAAHGGRAIAASGM